MARRIAPELFSATSGYPIDINSVNKRTGLDFLQLMDGERFMGVCEGLAGANFALNQVFIISGSVSIGGGYYSSTGGWAYIRTTAGVNELIYFEEVAHTSLGGNSYLNAAVTETADLDDPIKASDGTNVSPHKVRTINFTPAASASTTSVTNGLFVNLQDATLWININALLPNIVGAAGQPAFATGFSNGSGSYRLGFFRKANGLININGTCELGTFSANQPFTLPAGYLPFTYAIGTWVDLTSPTSYTGMVTVDTSGNVKCIGLSSSSDNHIIGIDVPDFSII